MDATSEGRLSAVHPELAKRIQQLASMLPFRIIVTQGLRTYIEQETLYQQGRNMPGNIVTNAPAGYSAHNFGYAVDVAPLNEDGSVDWNGKDEKWQEILASAVNCKLAEGATWRTFPDEPHLYLEELPANPTDAMRSLFYAGGLEAVWNSFTI